MTTGCFPESTDSGTEQDEDEPTFPQCTKCTASESRARFYKTKYMVTVFFFVKSNSVKVAKLLLFLLRELHFSFCVVLQFHYRFYVNLVDARRRNAKAEEESVTNGLMQN